MAFFYVSDIAVRSILPASSPVFSLPVPHQLELKLTVVVSILFLSKLCAYTHNPAHIALYLVLFFSMPAK